MKNDHKTIPTPRALAAATPRGGSGRADGHPPPAGREDGPVPVHGAALSPPTLAHDAVLDQADADEAALVAKVRNLLAAGQPWSAVAVAAGIPPSVAALWLEQHPEAVPATRAGDVALDLPGGGTVVYLEGHRYDFPPPLTRLLVLLLARPGSTLPDVVHRLRLTGPAAGHKALGQLNDLLRDLAPPLARPFRFRVKRGVVERAAPAAVAAPREPEAVPAAAVPLREAVGKFLAHLVQRGLSFNTVESYRYDLAKYEAWAWRADGLADPLAPTLDQLEAFIRHLSAGDRAASSLNRCCACLRTFSRWLVSQGLTATLANAELLERARADVHAAAVLTVEEIMRLLAEPRPTDRLYLRDRCLLECLWSLGGRVSELADLRVADVDLAQKRAVLSGKGRRRRVAFLSERALDALKLYLAGQRPALAARSRNGLPVWLFLSRTGRRLSRCAIFNVVRTYIWRACLPREAAHPHAIRHSFATALLANGASLVNVRDLLGHESVENTQRYTHVTTQDLLAAHAKYHPAGGPDTFTQEQTSCTRSNSKPR
jgi:site-specific recombinase XerD